MDQHGLELDEHEGGGASGFEHARRAVYKRIKAIAALPILFGICTAGIVLSLPDRYEASAVIQIDPRQKSAAEAASDKEAPKSDQHTIESEIAMLRSAPIVHRVIDELGLGTDAEFVASWPRALASKVLRFQSPPETNTQAAVSGRIAVSRIRNTLLLSVGFSSNDPAKAARIANAIADAYLKDQMEAKWRSAATTLAPGSPNDLSAAASSAGGNLTASELVFETLVAQYGQSLQLPGARIVEKAEPPRVAAAPKRKSLVAMASATGLVIAIALALLLELSAPGGAKTHNVQQTLLCPHMTSIPAMFADATAQPPTRAARLVLAEPAGQYAEAIRNACTELQSRSSGEPSRVVLVVSALPGEGAELFASNLAHHLAMAGGSPLLVDVDLRMKALTRQLAGQSVRGLLDQIASHQPVEDAILRDGTTGLHFLPASGLAPIPLSVPSALRSAAFANAIAGLRERFATIILSAPPMLPVGDARVLADLADQIVFVTAWHKTPRQIAKQALTSLGVNQRKVVGAVLTDVADETDVSIMSFADIFDEIRRAASFTARAA